MATPLAQATQEALWLGPAVTAAIVSGAIAVVTLIANVVLTLNTNAQRLQADRRALERRSELDLRLAEQKMRLDRRLALERRRAEVAELILGDFYEMKRIFELVRSPMVWAWEMVAEDGVSEETIKNPGYGVMRRLRGHEEFFSRLEARRFTAAALFGGQVAEQYQAVIQFHNRLNSAGRNLLNYNEKGFGHMEEFLIQQRQIAFSTDPEADPIGSEIDAVVAAIEATCRPFLEAGTEE